MCTQKLAKQGCRRRLTVRPRDGADRCTCDLARQLHLGRDTDTARARRLYEGDALGHGRGKDEEIHPAEQFLPLCTKDAGDALRP